MGELVLVRHGQASFGAEDYDKLSPLGHQQSRWLGEYFNAHDLQFDRVLRGDLRRHRETAEGILSVIDAPGPEVDGRLDEFHYWQVEQDYIRHTGSGAPATDRAGFIDLFPAVFGAWVSGEVQGAEESFAEFDARVWGAMNDALLMGKTTLVVTSGGVIGVTLRRVLSLSAVATADLLLNTHNASVHRLEWEGGKLRLSLYNASPHLDPLDRAHARTYV